MQQTRTASKANEITAIAGGGWAQPAYDPAGNMPNFPRAGSPSTADHATFDAWNRLMSVSSGDSLIQENAYDAENRRVTKLVSGTMRHYYYSSNWQGLEERLGTPTAADRQFVWGLRYIDDLVLRDRTSERVYARQDANWNVTAICDSNGSVSERYIYEAYGQPTFLSPAFAVVDGSGYDWEMLFAGYRWDATIGLFHVRTRVLHPALGTWACRDPLGYVDGPNVYAYGRGRPASELDPMGTFCIIKLRCTRLGPPMIGPKHCGLRILDGNFPQDFHIGGGLGAGAICDIVNAEVSLTGDTSGYWTEYTWMKPDSVCQCIRATAAALNAATLPYTPVPREACGRDKSTCNSNYATKCLLQNCGITYDNWSGWSGVPVGWSHQMTRCSGYYYIQQPYVCHCFCTKSTRIDNAWCANAPPAPNLPGVVI